MLLQQRPTEGIWGGLWSFPETENDSDVVDISHSRFGISVQAQQALPKLSHAFTHFKLHIHPQQLTVLTSGTKISEAAYLWINIDDAMGAAIPTPVRKILQSLKMETL